jgi:branched-subunit amino acid ABC-type transport system permease component
VTAWLTPLLGNYFVAAALAVLSMMLLGLALEFGLLRSFYGRHHLDHVLVTFGLGADRQRRDAVESGARRD